MTHQIRVLRSPARFKALVCGRRWGKTALGLMAAVLGHGPTPGDLRGAMDGGNIWWVAPTYPQIVSSGIWRDLKRSCRQAAVRISEVDRTIELSGGGTITVKSADNEESLRGGGLDGVVMDEAAFIKPEVFTDVIRPALSDKRGWALFPSTPNGKNWFYKLFTDARQRAGWQAWQLPSSDNPLVSEAELKDVERTLGPRNFAQEHLAQFTDIEGALFPSWYFEDHIWADRWPDAFDVSVMAIDPSIGSEAKPGDYSAIAFLGLSGGKFCVEMNLERRPPIQLVEDAVRMSHRLRPAVVAVESNGFQAVLGSLFQMYFERENLPPLPLAMLHHHEKKIVRIQRLDPHLANKSIRFRRCAGGELTVEQLQMFPDKEWHDDGPDALEMAIRTMGEIVGGDSDFETEQVRP